MLSHSIWILMKHLNEMSEINDYQSINRAMKFNEFEAEIYFANSYVHSYLFNL